VESATGEVKDIIAKRGTKTILQKSDKHIKRKSTGILAGKQDVFVLFSKSIRQERFQILRNIRPNFGTSIV